MGKYVVRCTNTETQRSTLAAGGREFDSPEEAKRAATQYAVEELTDHSRQPLVFTVEPRDA